MNDEVKSFHSAFIIHRFAFSSLPQAITLRPFGADVEIGGIIKEQLALTKESTIGEHRYDSDTLFFTTWANSLKS